MMEKDKIQNKAIMMEFPSWQKSAKPGNLYDGEQQCELLVDGRSDLHQTLAFRQNPVLSGDLILSNSI